MNKKYEFDIYFFFCSTEKLGLFARHIIFYLNCHAIKNKYSFCKGKIII